MNKLEDVTIGIVTALPEESAAVCAVFGATEEIDMPGHGAGRKYALATVRTRTGAKHLVAAASTVGMGNNGAAIRTARLIEHCPNLKHVIMVGIAGAVPDPDNPSDHVRLGDIVVSNSKGIIQYDFVKKESKFTEHRHPPRPPSAALLEVVHSISAGALLHKRPWVAHIEKAIARLGRKWKRPAESYDKLQDQPAPAKAIKHPKDPDRQSGQPRVFSGPISSANTLLKDPRLRNALRDQFRVKAVEMEGSGVADATWQLEKSYLVVRGTCDYCNPTKADKWHNYAAIVAAAYARCIVESTPPAGQPRPAKQTQAGAPGTKPSPASKKITRERDVDQLTRVFHWLNPRMFDQFIDRLGYSRITLMGSVFFETFERIVTSTSFHLYDQQLSKRIQTLYSRWAACFRYAGIMDEHPNQQEAHFRMPSDVPTSEQQAEASRYVPTTAQPLRDALFALQNYVRRNYLEIDPSKAGQDSVSAYLKDMRSARPRPRRT